MTIKLCKNCRFVQGSKSPYPKDQMENCEPWYVCKRENINLVTGENKSLLCEDERRYFITELEPLHCGLSGKFYQEKEKG